MTEPMVMSLEDEMNMIMTGLQKKYPDVAFVFAFAEDGGDATHVRMVSNMDGTDIEEFLSLLQEVVDEPDTMSFVGPPS